ncbi:MAG: phosphodiester glycosidase family protein [Spirochaetaceae bacterium]|nr:phosphodiester glycosidase family protein [Spirochaetaceae bacterium]
MQGLHFLKRYVLLCALAFLAEACATAPPVPAPPKAASKSGSPETLVPYWQDFEPGIAYFAGTIQRPSLKLKALRIDLTDPSIGFIASGREPVDGVLREGVIPSVKITSFVKRYHCIAGINANPFSPVSGREGEARKIDGITVSQGTVVAGPHSWYDALVFYRDGRAAIVSQRELETLEDIENAVGGFHLVLRDGAVADRLLNQQKPPRHPRSAAGLSADGKTLYLLVIDGRQIGSVGATEAEIAAILQRLGAADGLNFDGGGSTALALRYPDGKVRAVNTPIHNGIPNQERGVASCLGVIRR